MKVKLVTLLELSVCAKHGSGAPWRPRQLCRHGGITAVPLRFTRREVQVKQLERGSEFPGSHVRKARLTAVSPENTLSATLSRASKPGVSGRVLKRREKPLLKGETAETLQRRKYTELARKRGAGQWHRAHVPLPKYTLPEFE